jgi:hypothetical protein
MDMKSGEMAQQLSDVYDAMTQDKHDLGHEKYGSVRFLEVDSLGMAMDEIVDLGNYARFTYIKLAMLQAWALEFETEIGAFLRHKEEFKLFMEEKGYKWEAEEIEAPKLDHNVAVDNGVPFVEAATQPDGFFNPFRKDR